jgi:hypothetical protein
VQRAERTLKFTTEKVVGNGSFGVVYEARIIETGETVAIKKVLQDRRFKVRVRGALETRVLSAPACRTAAAHRPSALSPMCDGCNVVMLAWPEP